MFQNDIELVKRTELIDKLCEYMENQGTDTISIGSTNEKRSLAMFFIDIIGNDFSLLEDYPMKDGLYYVKQNNKT